LNIDIKINNIDKDKNKMNEMKKFEQDVYCTDCGKYVGHIVHYGQYAPNMTAECPRGC
jgi:hypothetical protein